MLPGMLLVSGSPWSSFDPGLSYKQCQSGNHLVWAGLEGQGLCPLAPLSHHVCPLPQLRSLQNTPRTAEFE